MVSTLFPGEAQIRCPDLSVDSAVWNDDNEYKAENADYLERTRHCTWAQTSLKERGHANFLS
jgi:hypothetical protein